MAYSRSPYLRTVAAGVAVAVLLFAFVLNGAFSDEHTVRAIDDYAQGGAAALACLACSWRAVRAGGRWRLSWALVAVGLGCWAAGEGVWSYYEVVVRRDAPFPSAADIGFLGFPVLALAGLLTRPSAAFTGRGRIRVVLDGIMVAASLFVITWLTSLGGVFHAGSNDRFSFLVALAYPASDFVLLTVAVLVLIHGTVRAGLIVLCLGLVSLAVADSAFTFMMTAGTYHTGAFVDIAWFAGFLIIGFSSLMGQPDDAAGDERVEVSITLALPYVMVLLAAVAQVVQAVRDRIDLVTLLVTLAALTALVVRQFLVVLDNRRLTQSVLAQRAELSHRAFHDPLTGLANRALFYDRVEHALDLHRRDMRPVSVVFMDLDDFKTVNDLHGHDVGDTVLTTVAQRLLAAVRPGDTVARLGGDEFAVLVEDEGDCALLGARLLDAMAVPIVLGAHEVSVSASVGSTTLLPEHGGADVPTLLKQADVAMYAAKRGGKGRTVHYSTAVHLEPAPSATEEMERALVADVRAGAVEAAFQPMQRLATDEVLAHEALARWHHGGRAVPPDVFIPMAERLGVLADLDLIMVGRCLARVAAGSPGGRPVLVSANLGITRFEADGVAERLLELVARCGVPPHRLIIEISERDMVDPDTTDRVIATLRECGVGLAIDDFGVGWSNLARLDALRPDLVKLDRSLVTPLADRRSARTLLGHVIGLAHDLGALVVGEGVETPDQLQILRDLGCDAAQGYLIARPGPWPDVPAPSQMGAA